MCHRGDERHEHLDRGAERAEHEYEQEQQGRRRRQGGAGCCGDGAAEREAYQAAIFKDVGKRDQQKQSGGVTEQGQGADHARLRGGYAEG